MKNLKQNIDILVGIIKSVLSKVNSEKAKKGDPTKSEIYSHPIFQAMGDIIKSLDKISFQTSKEMIGKSLREDYSILE